ncbi:MAG: CbiX/SirB N-terminal domain-containing protein [Paracoccus sp. (in: a-proteobacteria)]|nr:CbiX/SirB N-terminal domain-containing protein [Paracoccus sp. (in: a-proteobacteria)]
MPRHAIIIAHGQPSDPAPQQAAIEALAAQVAALLPDWRIHGATLADDAALRRAVAAAGDGAVIYPMFMAAGWFTGSELPRRLERAGAVRPQILPPFGLDPALPDLCRAIVEKAAPENAVLLLVAHGSQRARGSANGANEMAAKLAPHLGRVVTAFIEEAPFVADQARDLGPDAICLPFFATSAEHVTDDIPKALDKAGFAGLRLPPVGTDARAPALIARAIAG